MTVEELKAEAEKLGYRITPNFTVQEGLFFPNLKTPIGCIGCGERDAEYDGGCMLMPRAKFEDYASQFACCPIKDLIKEYGAMQINVAEFNRGGD